MSCNAVERQAICCELWLGTVCRPALTLSRRQTRSERSGWQTAVVESVHRRTVHRGLGRAYNQCVQVVCRLCRSRSDGVKRWRSLCRNKGAKNQGGCRGVQRRDRLSLKSACGLRVSRPFLAPCRRLFGHGLRSLTSWRRRRVSRRALRVQSISVADE